MNVHPSSFPLQRFIRALPQPLRRIKVAQLLARMVGSPYQRIAFEQGELVGNVRDKEVANSLVRGTFADYGYFELAGRLLSVGDVHVDLGANYGFHTFGLFRSPISSTIQYVLIDANPDCVACLAASAALHPAARWQIFHAAAAATPGEVKFAFAPAATGGGQVVGAGEEGAVQITVPASRLDDLLAEKGIESIGLLKMDIEGSEPQAMQGLSRMLSSARVNFVYFEVNPTCLEQLQTDPLALFEEFTRHGYRLFWPHNGVDWILRTYGHGEVTASDLERFTVWGSGAQAVIAFDPARYRKGQFGQCDLLAVSPKCRVERGDDRGQA